MPQFLDVFDLAVELAKQGRVQSHSLAIFVQLYLPHSLAHHLHAPIGAVEYEPGRSELDPCGRVHVSNETDSQETHRVLEYILLHLEWHEATLGGVIGIEDSAPLALVEIDSCVWCIEDGIVDGLVLSRLGRESPSMLY